MRALANIYDNIPALKHLVSYSRFQFRQDGRKSVAEVIEIDFSCASRIGLGDQFLMKQTRFMWSSVKIDNRHGNRLVKMRSEQQKTSG